MPTAPTPSFLYNPPHLLFRFVPYVYSEEVEGGIQTVYEDVHFNTGDSGEALANPEVHNNNISFVIIILKSPPNCHRPAPGTLYELQLTPWCRISGHCSLCHVCASPTTHKHLPRHSMRGGVAMDIGYTVRLVALTTICLAARTIAIKLHSCHARSLLSNCQDSMCHIPSRMRRPYTSSWGSNE